MTKKSLKWFAVAYLKIVGNPEVIEQVLTRYKNTYHNRRSDLPVEADRTDYINKMRKAYPFHPELIDMFRLKWG